MIWKFTEAKSRLAEVVNMALAEGPQTIARGDDAVVVLSAAHYEELTSKRPDFKQFLFQGEGLDELDLTRDQSPMRDIDL